MQFTINRDFDCVGTSLRPLLEANFRYERISAAKVRNLHWLSFIGFWVWLAAIWPSLLPAPVEDVVLVLWAILFLIAVWTIVQSWTWHRKLTRYLSEHQAKQKVRSS